jgi:hypothetical protein
MIYSLKASSRVLIRQPCRGRAEVPFKGGIAVASGGHPILCRGFVATLRMYAGSARTEL